MRKICIYVFATIKNDKNYGTGGYGAIVHDPITGEILQELLQGYEQTTKPRLTLLAAAVALEHLIEPSEVRLYTNQTYLSNGGNDWIWKWLKKGILQEKMNNDIWLRIVKAMREHKVEFIWEKSNPKNEYWEGTIELAKYSLNNNILKEKQLDNIYIELQEIQKKYQERQMQEYRHNQQKERLIRSEGKYFGEKNKDKKGKSKKKKESPIIPKLTKGAKPKDLPFDL